MGEAAKTKQKPANMISGSSSRFAVFDQSSNWFNGAYVITSNHGMYSNDYELDFSNCKNITTQILWYDTCKEIDCVHVY